jgi:hypothetical protein
MSLKYLIENCDKSEPLLQDLLGRKAARLAVLEDAGRTYVRGDRQERAALKAEIFLIENGCGPMDGTSAEHWNILQRPEIRALNLMTPGLATIKAYRERLQNQLDAELAKERARTA